ncbi:hypothetical protein [Paractinoplanes rishiriensis]|uniref:Uncharacterized protein n=1 Tax=Paractinoplanes rishiriensis TaxID=1050105 RepID=A0A919KA31_9ACTN|nr:hypothetical protein [Actinoplanes rishiriensis]GIF02243.1 hypothetical protein Ari01nite_97070 [Actinoplanes rishiriensis]
MGTSAPTGRGVTVTIKYGRGYEAPWAVFHGQPHEIRDDIAAFFGMTAATTAGLTLSDIVVNATAQAHGVETIASGLGGATVIESQPTPTATAPTATAPAATASAAAGPTAAASTSATAAAADPWSQASAAQAPAAAQPAGNPLLDRIARATDVQSLQRIWADDPSAFTDPAVMAAWKARGRALTTN